METSANLNLPFLAAAQAQKHVTLNEALDRLDTVVQLSVADVRSDPPAAMPGSGVRFIVGADASGTWAGEESSIAVSRDGGWTFLAPATGWIAWNEASEELTVFDGTEWTGASAIPIQLNDLEGLGVNTSADATNRLSVRSAVSRFSHEGGDHRLVVNKAASSATASVVFQSDTSGRAEIGLAGDDRLHAKVSSDGSTFREALVIDPATANVRFPGGVAAEQLAPSHTQEVAGPPNLCTVCAENGNIVLSPNRLYFSAFLVDRPTTITGVIAAVRTPGDDPAGVMRAGIFELGAPDAGEWTFGPLSVDMGTLPASTTGEARFAVADAPLEPGWYVAALGADCANVTVNYAEWMSPGVSHHVVTGTGDGTRMQVAGAATRFHVNDQGAAIRNGLHFLDGAIAELESNVYRTRQLLVPTWRRWP